MESASTLDGLSLEELDSQEAAELPARHLMQLVGPTYVVAPVYTVAPVYVVAPVYGPLL